MPPLEVITLLGSSLLGGALKLFGRGIEARRLERHMTLEALSHKAQLIDQARRYENPGFTWTRRLIALTSVFFIVAFPKLVVLLAPAIPVHVGYSELVEGFPLFGSDSPRIVWRELRGLVITPLDTHLLSAIIGLYFGGSLIR